MVQQKDHSASMGTESISRLLLRFSLPSTIAMLVNASYNIIDTIFVGRLGSDAIAALSVCFPIQMLLGGLAIGTGIGAASLISRSLGAGKRHEAATAAGQVFLLALVFGLLTFLGGFFYLRPLLLIFGATPDILELSEQYLSIISYGAVLLFLIMILNHTVRAEGNVMLSMTVMILSAITNIILDPIFIFVLGFGIRGAAIATVVSKVVGVGILLWYFAAKKSTLNVHLFNLAPNWPVIIDIYRVGLPSLFIQISANISLIVVNRILGSYGYIPIALMGLFVRLQMFAFMPVIGISHGLLPIIGYNFGACQYPRIREAMIKGIGLGTVFVTFLGLAFFAFPGVFLRIFSSDTELLELGETALRIMVIMYPLIAAQTISIVFFQAIGRGTSSLWLSLLRQFLLYIPFILLMPRFFNLTGIWLATPIADLLAFAVTAAMVSREFSRRGIPLLAQKV